jgi:cathepsin B
MIKGDPDLPEYYNVREAYPMCQPEVLDQGMCGSCWAFSSSAVLSDRFCMRSEGKIDVTLSPQDMVNCDFENFGCNGGYMVPAIDFLITEGVTHKGCMDYTGAQNSCSFRCDDQDGNYDKYYCKPGSLNIATSIKDM